MSDGWSNTTLQTPGGSLSSLVWQFLLTLHLFWKDLVFNHPLLDQANKPVKPVTASLTVSLTLQTRGIQLSLIRGIQPSLTWQFCTFLPSVLAPAFVLHYFVQTFLSMLSALSISSSIYKSDVRDFMWIFHVICFAWASELTLTISKEASQNTLRLVSGQPLLSSFLFSPYLYSSVSIAISFLLFPSLPLSLPPLNIAVWVYSSVFDHVWLIGLLWAS